MKAKQISSPMVGLATYLTLLMYYGFLFVYIDKLHVNIERMQLYLIAIYPISDFGLFFLRALGKNLEEQGEASQVHTWKVNLSGQT